MRKQLTERCTEEPGEEPQRDVRAVFSPKDLLKL